ncbi:unnamed protein product, partial [marine sediment metagenome]
TGEHINQEMNTRKRQQLHPVKFGDSSIQVSTDWRLKFFAGESLVCLDVFFAGFGPDIIGQLDALA